MRATGPGSCRVREWVRAVAHRVVQRAPCRVGHHEAGRLLDARSVQPDHVWVAHARERPHLAAHGLGDGAQRRLARLAMVAAALLLDRDAEPLGWKVGEGGWITVRVPVYLQEWTEKESRLQTEGAASREMG